MTEPKLKSIAPWFGGKRSLASDIVTELGEHDQYFEPFCGGISILFAKPASRQETVNDLHDELINLARVLQGDRVVELYDRCERTLFGDHVINEVRRRRSESIEPVDDVDQAYWYLCESWMGRNGVSGTQRSRGTGYSLAVRWTAGGGSAPTRWRSAVDSIPAWHERLQNVVILQRDAFAIIPKFHDSPRSAIYVDPPYASETRSGYSGAGGQSRYEHEFDHNDGQMFGDDHTRLRDALASFKHARIVVSYYDCERIRELYDGWTFIDKSRHKNLHSQNKRGSSRSEAAEILIVNGGSYA